MSRPPPRERPSMSSSSREPEVRDQKLSSTSATVDTLTEKDTSRSADVVEPIKCDLLINGAIGVTVKPSSTAVPRCVNVDEIVVQSRSPPSSGGIRSPVNGVTKHYHHACGSREDVPSSSTNGRAPIAGFDDVPTCSSRVATGKTGSMVHQLPWSHRYHQPVAFSSSTSSARPAAALISSVPLTAHQSSAAYLTETCYSTSPTGRRRFLVTPTPLQSTSQQASPLSCRVTACEPTADHEPQTQHLHHYHHHHQQQQQQQLYSQVNHEHGNQICSPPSFLRVFSVGGCNDGAENGDCAARESTVEGPSTTTTATMALAAILGELRLLTANMRKKEDYDTQCEDWKFAAMVVDRVCLILFSVFTVVSTFAIIFSAPHVIA